MGWILAEQGNTEASEDWYSQALAVLAKVAADPMTKPNFFGAVRPKTDSELGNARLDLESQDPKLSVEEIALKTRTDVQSDDWTLCGVVGNPHAPNEVVTDILHRANGNMKILLSAGAKPLIPEVNARAVAKWPNTASSLAPNPACSIDLIKAYVVEDDWVVRNFVTRNPAAPTPLLEVLASDSDSRVVVA